MAEEYIDNDCQHKVDFELPPYSPDMTPCDGNVVQRMEKSLRGKKFTRDEEVKNSNVLGVNKLKRKNSFVH